MFQKILPRSSCRYGQKKLAYSAFFAYLLVVVSFCTVLKPYLRMSIDNGLKVLMTTDPTNWQDKDFSQSNHFTLLSDAQEEHIPLEPDIFDEDENASSESEIVAPAVNIAAQLHYFDQKENVIQESNFKDLVRDITVKLDFAVSVKNFTIEKAFRDEAKNTTDVSEGTIRGKISAVKSEIICNFTMPRSNSCSIRGDVRVKGNSSTVIVPQFEPEASRNNLSSWTIKPYARKTDKAAMENVREWRVKYLSRPQDLPGCSVNHTVPAIIFSNSGYSGNHFHAFSETVLPLFLSARNFNGEVQFLVTDHALYWLNKYRLVLEKLSKYEIIDIDNEVNTHCFPNVIVGLTLQKELGTDPSMPPYSSLADFTEFLRDAYSLPKSDAIVLSNEEETRKPRLIIISRKGTRRLMNEGKIVKLAKNLGYKVVLAEGSNSASLAKFAESINSCDVLLGVHGAGLTNIVFLPRNAVFIQIVPLGMEAVSDFYYGKPAREMKLKYLEYKIRKEESSLIQQYPADHVLFLDPGSFQRQGYREIFMDKQDVHVDIKQLKPVLVKAMELLH